MKIPVHSVGSAPVMGTSDYGNTGSESPNTLTRKRKVVSVYIHVHVYMHVLHVQLTCIMYMIT